MYDGLNVNDFLYRAIHLSIPTNFFLESKHKQPGRAIQQHTTLCMLLLSLECF